VRTYGQYCPIARASELLAERWSFIILRNIVLIGCRTFNEIADGAPGLSRGLLSKRLRDLERAGVVEIRPKPDGPGSTYEPTQAGRELSEVMLALQHWGSQWAELTPEHAHPGVVLWGWVTCHLDRGRLPRRRVLVRFEYPTLSGPGSRGWLLIERGDAEICEKHPGGDEDLVVVVSDPVAFARWDLGELEWSDALRGGAIEVPLGSAASTRSGARLPRGRQLPPPEAPPGLGHPPPSGPRVQTLHFSCGPAGITIETARARLWPQWGGTS
jgi:DNA-binding HxlR family transcriptional regulator